MLGIHPGSSGRVVSAVNCRAAAPARLPFDLASPPWVLELLLVRGFFPEKGICSSFLACLDPEICLEEELPEEITAEIFATEILGLAISDSSGQLDQ